MLDDTERRIIRILTKDARVSSTHLARELGMPVSTVIYRIKRLKERGVIGGSTIVLHTRAFGFQSFQLNVTLQHVTEKEIRRLLSYCGQHPHIIFAIRTLGPWNLEIIYEVPDAPRMQACIMDLRRGFKDTIKDLELLNIFEDYIKLDHYPFR